MKQLIQERIYHLRYNTATFAIITERYRDRVIAAAPIANWTKGKKYSQCTWVLC